MTNIKDPKMLLKLLEKPYLVVEPPNDKILEIWKSPAKYKCLLGGNRSGKTESVVIETIWHLTGEHPFIDVPRPPVRWRYHVPNFKSLSRVLEEKFRRYLPKSLLHGGSWENAMDYRLSRLLLSNGSMIDFTTHRISITAIEGASLDGVVIDEECSHEQFRALLYRLIDRQGKMLVSVTPINGVSWLMDDFVIPFESGNPNYFVVYVSTYENKFLNPEDVKIIEETATPEEKEIRLYGRIQNISRRVYRGFNKHRHVLEGSIHPPLDMPIYIGLDWGFFHNSALVFAVRLNDKIYIIGEWENKRVTLEGLSRYIENWAEENGISHRNIIVVYDKQLDALDAAGQRPSRVIGFRKLPATKQAVFSIDRINEAFNNDRIFIYENCRNLLAGLEKMYYTQTGRIDDEDEHKDITDAFRYVCFHLLTHADRSEVEVEEEGITDAQTRMKKAIEQQRYERMRRLYGKTSYQRGWR